MDATSIEHYSTQHHRRQTSTFGQFRFFINFINVLISLSRSVLKLGGNLMNEVIRLTSS